MKTSIGISEFLFPNPALVVGTYDASGVPNAVTLAWGGVASSRPQAISIAVRPERYSYENLMSRKAFTVNLPAARHVKETDYFGIASGRDGNKFERTGLTPMRSEFVDAPYIEEFPYNIECVVTHTLDLGAHTLFIGEVKNVLASASLTGESGKLSWEKADLLLYDSVSRTYRTAGDCVAKAFSIGLSYRGE